MKILFYDTKNYDRESFELTLKNFPGISIEYTKSDLDPRTAALAEGFDAVCAFVSSDIGTQTLEILHAKQIRLLLMRCAGFNNVDLGTAKKYGIRVMRVPGYSPEAVAEHAMALALASNRRLYKAYNKVRENDFSLSGLKSALLKYMNSCQMKGEPVCQADVAASFQKAVIDVLVEHSLHAVRKFGYDKFAIAGGVASNSSLRAAFEEACGRRNIRFYRPSPVLCTDNAAMIGAAGYYEYLKGIRSGYDLNAVPNLRL